MHDVAVNCVRSKDAQKQLVRTSLSNLDPRIQGRGLSAPSPLSAETIFLHSPGFISHALSSESTNPQDNLLHCSFGVNSCADKLLLGLLILH